MKRSDFRLPAEGEQLHVMVCRPEGQPKAVLQIVHGMQEYIGRYAEFAEWLCERGYAVVGHDHPGHGETADGKQLGFFAEKDGDELVQRCIEAVTEWIRKEFAGVPVFLLGHSMGSFFSRRELTRHGDRFAGAVIMGTAQMPKPLINAACAMAGVISKTKGPRYNSAFLAKNSNGAYNKRFEAEGKNAWLSKNKESVTKYNRDPFCHFHFSCGAYRDMFKVIRSLSYEKDMEKIPKDLPIFVVSGADDPVGDFGKGTVAAFHSLQARAPRTRMRLYKNMRHEILNEPEREIVYQDLLDFFEENLPKTEA